MFTATFYLKRLYAAFEKWTAMKSCSRRSLRHRRGHCQFNAKTLALLQPVIQSAS